MNVTLTPDAQKFIDEQVRAGRFHSPDQVLEAAIDRLMAEAELELDDQTVAAINRAELQIDHGEGFDFDQFAAEMRKHIAAK